MDMYRGEIYGYVIGRDIWICTGKGYLQRRDMWICTEKGIG